MIRMTADGKSYLLVILFSVYIVYLERSRVNAPLRDTILLHTKKLGRFPNLNRIMLALV